MKDIGITNAESKIPHWVVWALAFGLFCAWMPAATADGDGVCARVTIRLDQTAVMTRTAFRATLEITDHDPSTPLSAVSAQVEIKDSAGNVANSRFQIEAPTLESIDRIDGSGTIPANSTAIIRWLLIPSDEAAPTAETDFFVGGQFSYNLGGNQATIPLEPVKIQVYPDAALDLVYFHIRDVFSDDPFTPQIEPAIPYALAVMVKNRGAGAAKGLTISSAQPQIVDNQKGLAIEFRLVGAMLDGTNVANSLSLNFGQVDPGSIRIAEWFFTSSLQGFFHNFSATFQHQDDLGNIHLSTIKSVSIHEMTHIVEAGYGLSDGNPDFLVNDVPDPDNLPDTLYFSNGTTNAVQAVQQSSFDSVPSVTHLQVQLTTPTPSGWVYLRVPEPSGGQLALTGVTRSDGTQIKLGVNAWTTDRVFPGPSVRAITTNLLHIFDYNSSGIYTLTYQNAGPADSTPPTSQVAVLPAQTQQQFPVTWSGQDNAGGTGLASFDIFVSENNGPFLPWLQQTTLRGAIYSGNAGSSYAFYSVATDNAGNKESAHGSPDATTAVTLVNHPPVLAAIPDQAINEGVTFARNIIASDPDAGDILTYSLGPGAPTAMTLAPNTGQLSWPTGETDGPGTNLITVIVRDNGAPPLSATNQFTLVVREVNSAPVFLAVADQTLNGVTPLNLILSATDSDIPANTLTFGLVSGPAGLTVSGAGVVKWTPTNGQAPSTNGVVVKVMDDGVPPLSATNQFVVVVREMNQPPVLAVIALQTVNELTLLTVTNTASEANLHSTVGYALVNPPAGVSIATNGVITWTPSESQGPGTNVIATVATSTDLLDLVNPTLTATNSFTVVVNEVNTSPVLTVPATQTVNELATLSVSASATDSDIPANPLTFALVSAPSDMAINPGTGLITWTPSQAESPSTNLIQVSVTDTNPAAVNAKSLSVTNSFTVIVREVNQAPVLASIPPQTVNELTLLTVTNTASDANIHATLTYALVNPPPGAVIDSHGVITWTPSQAESPSTNMITTVATSTDNLDLVNPTLTATNSFQVIVREVNQPPGLPVIGLQTVNELTLLTVTNAASEANLHSTVGYALVNPPAGASIAANGVITWTPSESQGPGTNVITTVAGSTNLLDLVNPTMSATNSFTVVVNEVNTPPVIAVINDLTVNPGQTVGLTIPATDADIPTNPLTFTLLASPPGMTINAASGWLAWRPTMAQANTTNLVNVQATDNNPWAINAQQLSATRPFRITVNPLTPVVLQPLGFTSDSFHLRVSGPLGPDYILQGSPNLHDWLSLTTNTPQTLPFTFGDTNTANFSYRFYRVRLGP